MIKTTDVTVGEDTYHIKSFLAPQGLKFFTRLIKYLGGALSGLIGQDLSSLDTSALLAVAASLEIDGMDALVIEMMKDHILKNGQPVNFNMEFAANYGVLAKLFIHQIKLNYESFLEVGDISLG